MNKNSKWKLMGVIFINHSKAFDSINRKLLVAKLKAYTFLMIFLHLMRREAIWKTTKKELI